MAEIDYKKKCEEYEKRMGIGEFDPAKDGYLVMVDILRQHTEYLKDFKVKSIIASDDASKKIEYKNAKDLWEGLPSMIKGVSTLRLELKMDGEEKKTLYSPISAKEIANGNV
jgi:hypothetical protein